MGRSTSIVTRSVSMHAASRRPVTNCDETVPGSVNVPPVSGPETVRGNDPGAERRAWCAQSSSHSGESGRLASLPCPWMLPPPRAQSTGSMKRSVEPDSPQSRCAPSGILSPAPSRGIGTTRKPMRVRVTRAPNADRQVAVASMSLDVVGQSSVVVLSLSAASTSRRCATDFEAIAPIVPARGEGSMVTLIATHRSPGQPGRRAPGH